ncbi:hypothetical protein KYK29_09880 [Shinella daejeonensis]|uniref:hypothetical protein n=1 Tax=Shinella daejeonensis TaxID=659017 RepID=UPI0020C77839|nr:hypothetical protein [Shinella daejeonensis]MCP8895242.1 hypothetical protein [Shinella daejeonensis]
METRNAIQLHFDCLSRRALLSYSGKDYVLPDLYENRDAARAAAQLFAWERLDLKSRSGRSRQPSDIAIWLR